MGGAPRSEDLEAAANRELKEETGLTATRLRLILKMHTSNSVTDEEGYVFLAEGLTPGAPEFDETEQLAIHRLPFTEALAMAMDGRITDGITVAGILKLGPDAGPVGAPSGATQSASRSRLKALATGVHGVRMRLMATS